MIWRVRERSSFRRISVEGKRTRAGALWCTFVIDPMFTPPQVAFAIGRAFGPAVVRNRLRRRLRALLRATPPPPGLYLIGAQPAAAERSFTELSVDLERMLAVCNQAARRGSS
ncbi:MAG: ribonuclease P protein component [Ilumatobacteraceae bacterium]